MEEKITKQPSAVQCEHFTSLTGYPYPQGTTKGQFKTDRPYNNHEWKLSPWHVRYVFKEDEKSSFVSSATE